MSLKKLLFILSGTTAAVILLSGSVLLWMAAERLNTSIKSSFQSIAESVASIVEDDLMRKTQTVDLIGADLFCTVRENRFFNIVKIPTTLMSHINSNCSDCP